MDSVLVVKIGGRVLDEPALRDPFLDAFAALPGAKVLVHGGGASASALARRMGVEPVMVDGRRVTDDETLRIVTMTYAGSINKDLAARLIARGCRATGIAALDGGIVRARRRPVVTVDFGNVGDVDGADPALLLALLAGGFVPVIAPVTSDGAGALLNTNADTIASAIATALAAHARTALLFCFERDGVLADASDDASRIPALTRTDADRMIADGTASAGMLPKLEAAFRAADAGVHRVFVCAARDLATVAAGEGLRGTEILATSLSPIPSPFGRGDGGEGRVHREERRLRAAEPGILAAWQLLQDLIRIPSFSREEHAAADRMQAFLNDHGVRTMRDGCNVWARGGNPDPAAPVLLLNSHLDTVRPASTWTRDPFTPEVEDGVLYGLGSNDAGAALCAMAGAFLALREADLPFALVFAATAEEEIAGTGGIERALPLIGRVDAAVVGEPTGMQMAVAERGLVVLDCTAHGRAGHAARSTGLNAIELAMRDIEWFRTFRFPRVSPLLGDVKMTVTQISAGVQHNVIPEKCSFVVDVRVPDTYTLEEVVETVRAHVVCDAVPRSLRLRSSSIDMAHPLVAAARACRIGTFASPTLSDQARIAAPSVKLGPGLSERSHTADEFITEAEFRAGVDGYIALLTALTLEASDETVG